MHAGKSAVFLKNRKIRTVTALSGKNVCIQYLTAAAVVLAGLFDCMLAFNADFRICLIRIIGIRRAVELFKFVSACLFGIPSAFQFFNSFNSD